MQPFTDRSDNTQAQPDANIHSNVRLTVQEASAALGITVEAVRGRMHRGKYGREKTKDGRVLVLLTPEQLSNGQTDSRERSDERLESTATTVRNQSHERSPHVRERLQEEFTNELVEELRDHVAFLRAELEARNEELRRREEEHREEARRKDTIIAQLTQRIPAIEAPTEAPRDERESPVTASKARGDGDEDSTGYPEQEKRSSWWRRLFG
jgi:hypothetical protein